MTTQYVMRAFKTTGPTGYVYWSVLGAPDFTGSQSGYNPADLSDIVLDYSVQVPINGSGGVVAPGLAGGDLSGTFPNPSVVAIQGTPVSSASVAHDDFALVSTNGVWTPTGIIPVFNVKTFGAVGDGITDDTVAIHAAINAGAPIGGIIYFPHNNPNSTPTLISTTTGNAVSPIEVTTSTPHGLSTGQLVWVTGIHGNTAANGYFVCTFVDTTHITLNGTTGNGAFINGGAAITQVAGYKVTSPLTVYPNTRLVGDGSTYISGFALSPTTIYDARIGSSTPLITFTPDMTIGDGDTVPTTRGCYLKGIAFICPDPSKTSYSYLMESTGLTVEDCHFQGAEVPGGGDPGMWRLLAFEGVSFIRCTFIWGTKHFSFLGSGAGGPFKLERCWFYDCTDYWLNSDSNGDSAYTIDGCAFDPLYRVANPAYGLNLAVNGFVIRGCAFNSGIGNNVSPFNSYVNVTGVGTVTGCIFRTNTTGLQLDSCNCEVSNNVFDCYTGVNVTGGGSVMTGSGNNYTPVLMADITGDNFPYNAKRGVILNEPAVSGCSFNIGPDNFIASDGYFLLESYHVGGQPAVGVITGTSSGTGGHIVIALQQAHNQTTGNIIDVGGVTGTTEANGLNITVTVVDSTHLLLQGTTFVHAYTGGGRTQYHNFVNTQQFTNGTITYTKAIDQSTNGPILGGITTLNQTDGVMLVHGNGAVIGAAEQYPNLITNENFDGYTLVYTLPPIIPGMVYEFQKKPVFNSQNVTPTIQINTDATDAALGFGQIMIYGTANGTFSITNANTSDFNGSVRLRAVYYYEAPFGFDTKRWIVDDAGSNWQSTTSTSLAKRNNITITTTNYNVLVTDQIIVVGTIGSTITVTLPSSPNIGDTYLIKDGNGSAAAHNITVSGNGNNIDGNSTYVMTNNYAAITLVYTTANQWSVC